MTLYAKNDAVYKATITHTTNHVFPLQLLSGSIYITLIHERNSKIDFIVIEYILTYFPLHSKNLRKMDLTTATPQRSSSVNRNQKLQVSRLVSMMRNEASIDHYM